VGSARGPSKLDRGWTVCVERVHARRGRMRDESESDGFVPRLVTV